MKRKSGHLLSQLLIGISQFFDLLFLLLNRNTDFFQLWFLFWVQFLQLSFILFLKFISSFLLLLNFLLPGPIFLSRTTQTLHIPSFITLVMNTIASAIRPVINRIPFLTKIVRLRHTVIECSSFPWFFQFVYLFENSQHQQSILSYSQIYVLVELLEITGWTTALEMVQRLLYHFKVV